MYKMFFRKIVAKLAQMKVLRELHKEKLRQRKLEKAEQAKQELEASKKEAANQRALAREGIRRRFSTLLQFLAHLAAN